MSDIRCDYCGGHCKMGTPQTLSMSCLAELMAERDRGRKLSRGLREMARSSRARGMTLQTAAQGNDGGAAWSGGIGARAEERVAIVEELEALLAEFDKL
jgi:hypothetical protein